METTLPENICSNCHQPMNISRWNKKMNMAVCLNANCTMYRKPVSTTEVPPVRETEPQYESSKKGRANPKKRIPVYGDTCNINVSPMKGSKKF